jgi:hypothetical protein
MDEGHKFDLIGHIHELKMDTYARMKFINFMRKKVNLLQNPDGRKIFLSKRNSTHELLTLRLKPTKLLRFLSKTNGTKKKIWSHYLAM